MKCNKQFDDQMQTSVFTYGSLMIPRVFGGLVNEQKRWTAATLHGFKRTKIQGVDYPAIKPVAGGLVDGVVWHNIASDELEALDQFESMEYQRRTVTVESAQRQSLQCQAYVYRPEFYHRLIDEPWSIEEFKRFYLSGFLSRHQL